MRRSDDGAVPGRIDQERTKAGAGETARGPGVDDLARIAQTIRSSITTDGLALVTTRLSAEDFKVLGRMIGTVDLQSDIRVDPARRRAQMATRSDAMGKARPSGYQAESLALHTDRLTAAVLAWYCVEQGETGGETILVDVSDVAEQFSSDELTILCRTPISYAIPRPDAEEQVYQQPLLTRVGARYEVFYMPWSISEPSQPEDRRVLEKFADYLRRAQDQRAIRVRLQPGESLFIDNRRMLHGRDALPETSKRHLLRLYISTSPAPRQPSGAGNGAER